MAGQRNYLRIPPDSTGKRLAIKHTSKIYYTSKNPAHNWDIDTEYSLGTSGISGVLHDWYQETENSGYIILVLNEDDRDNDSINPITSESIIYNSNSVAVVSSYHDVFYNITTITGGHPEHELNIDYTGSANIRFAEGQPQLDAFGKLKTSGTTVQGDYTFTSDILESEFSSSLVGGNASVSHNHSRRCLQLDLTADTNSYTTYDYNHQGLVSHTSNTYHHYTPGISQLYLATVMLGDTGQVNLTRTWGYHDFNDGFMFQQVDGVLGVNIRNSASAAAQSDLFIPQSQWNGDKLDGTGDSKMILDVTKDNLYWIDFQWLGAGTVRFGVYNDGQRLVCHSYHHTNRYQTASAGTGNLPVCQSQMATGTIVGTVSMYVWCIGVFTEGPVDFLDRGSNKAHSFSKSLTNVQNQYYYIGALSPKLNDDSGLHFNHSLYFPYSIDILALDSTGNGIPGELETYAEPVLSGMEFIDAEGSVQQDLSATFYGGGNHEMIEFVGNSGFRNVDIIDRYKSVVNGAFKNYSCQGGTNVHGISNISNASPAIITISDPEWQLREVNHFTYDLRDVLGMTEINSDQVYLKITSLNTAELYTDVNRTIPLDTTGYGTYTSGGEIYGFRGTRFMFAFLWKPFSTVDHTVRVKIHWKEIIQ